MGAVGVARLTTLLRLVLIQDFSQLGFEFVSLLDDVALFVLDGLGPSGRVLLIMHSLISKFQLLEALIQVSTNTLPVDLIDHNEEALLAEEEDEGDVAGQHHEEHNPHHI